MIETDTIAALSSGRPPSGIAVVRLSGPHALAVAGTLAGGAVPWRRPVLRALVDPETGAPIDRGLVLAFDGPRSATGEDVCEFHVHGGPAVVDALLSALVALPGVRVAEPGEFTRRAFLNGRMDLTEVEGLADLIAAETEAQRRQALRLVSGLLRRTAEEWRRRLIAVRAEVEAALDFSDEGDVGEAAPAGASAAVERLLAEIRDTLDDARAGERLREGFRVAIVGPPNAGKSSLVNALARRDVAIVTAVPGTTRDAIEVRLDLAGYPVTVVDTAGLRETDDPVEAIGVERALAAAREADCVLLLWDATDGAPPETDASGDGVLLRVANKIDRLEGGGAPPEADCAISATTGEGLPALLNRLGALAAATFRGGESALVTRVRQREHLAGAAAALERAVRGFDRLPLEIVAEELRQAGDDLGRLGGRIDVEDVLGDIFATFCIGK